MSFLCDICDRSSTRSYDMLRHKDKLHEDDPTPDMGTELSDKTADGSLTNPSYQTSDTDVEGSYDAERDTIPDVWSNMDTDLSDKTADKSLTNHSDQSKDIDRGEDTNQTSDTDDETSSDG